jgi:hypothetical protein
MLKPESQLLLDAFDEAAQECGSINYEATSREMVDKSTEKYIVAKDALVEYIRRVELVEYIHRLQLDD